MEGVSAAPPVVAQVGWLRAVALDAFRLTNGLVLLAIIFVPLERVFAQRRQTTLRPGLGADVGFYYLSSLLPMRVLALALAPIAWLAPHLASAAMHGRVAALPFWVRMMAALTIAEIGFYWGHRWSHRFDWLWRFHSVHHTPARMDWLVNTHAHPVDLVFTRLCGYLPLYLLGLAGGVRNGVDWLPLLVALIGSMWGYFIHANLRWRFGPLEEVVATPAFHHWHHNNSGAGRRHQNYAPMFPWVDRLFGTRSGRTREWPAKYGVTAGAPLTESLRELPVVVEEAGDGHIGHV